MPPSAVTEPSTPAPSLPPSYVSGPPTEVTYFYNNLLPYGSWIELPGYGWCWQPSVVVMNRGWRPYCDGGHWVYSDAGWYWASDYSWGWAPFHYGRWFSDPRCGWVWIPDLLWGPAWVSWRTGGDFCGWAPLPPHADFDVKLGLRFNGVKVGLGFDFGLGADVFTFVALKDFNDHDLRRRRVGRTDAPKVYKETTVMNNYVVIHKQVVNEGIKVERVAAATHTEVRKATLRDLPAGSAGMAQAHGWEKSGLVVYRPELKAPTKGAATLAPPMVAQKLDEKHPVIQHFPKTYSPAVSTHSVAPQSVRPSVTPDSGRKDPNSDPRKKDF